MQLLTIILNLPWSVATLLFALLCTPRKVQIHWQPFAVVVSVKTFRVIDWKHNRKGMRAMTQGNVILLGPHLLQNDLEHELVHIEQRNRAPFIHPFLYVLEGRRHGWGPKNKYEYEAYTRAGNPYLDK